MEKWGVWTGVTSGKYLITLEDMHLEQHQKGDIMEDLKTHFITTIRPFTEGAVEVFEQEIPVRHVRQAFLTITALGIYEAELNGRKVGDLLFTPGYTYYPKNLHYQRWDVTELLSDDTVLRVYLSQGWYCGRFTYENKTQI